MVTERETGITVAAHWTTLDTEARRDYPLRAGVQVRVAGPDGNLVAGRPPPHKVIGVLARA